MSFILEALATLDRPAPETRSILDEWNFLHGVRTALALAAFVLFLL